MRQSPFAKVPFSRWLVGLALLTASACEPPSTQSQSTTNGSELAAAQGCNDAACLCIRESTRGVESEVCDAGFANFWRSHGGLPILGHALTVEGGGAQWFERARLESRSRNRAGFRVLAGLVGSEYLAKRDACPGALAGASRAWLRDCIDPPSEAYRPYQVGAEENATFVPNEVVPALPIPAIYERFASLWQKHGLMTFGYPLTRACVQTIAGKDVRVQYFERARFEEQPNGTVTLGRLGASLLDEPSICVDADPAHALASASTPVAALGPAVPAPAPPSQNPGTMPTQPAAAPTLRRPEVVFAATGGDECGL
jgi:hypothetical protein